MGSMIILLLGSLSRLGLSRQEKDESSSEVTICHEVGTDKHDFLLNCEDGLINIKHVKYGYKSEIAFDNKGQCNFNPNEECFEKKPRMKSLDYSNTAAVKKSFMNVQLKNSGFWKAMPIECSNSVKVNYVEITYECLSSNSILCMGKCNSTLQEENVDSKENFASDVGYIKSSNYPSLYPSSHSGKCFLKAVEDGAFLLINAEDFQLEDSFDCFRDSLKIYGHRRRHEVNHCGRTPKGTQIFASEGEATIEFKTDEYVSARGFLIKFWAMKPDSQKVGVKAICNYNQNNPFEKDIDSPDESEEPIEVKIVPVIITDESSLPIIAATMAAAIVLLIVIVFAVMRALRKKNKINADNHRKAPIMTLPGEESGIYIPQRGSKIGDHQKQFVGSNWM